jgi:ABC-type Zn uptake system ZnuABC Zn-binding protein ZnuA
MATPCIPSDSQLFDNRHHLTESCENPGPSRPAQSPDEGRSGQGGRRRTLERPATTGTPEPDPHAWLDPILTKTYVDRIRDTLTRVDPAHAAAYAERATAYQKHLDALDAWIRDEVAQVPATHRKLATFHDAFQYFAKRHGFAVRAYVASSPGKEPSAKAMADLIWRVKHEQIPTIFAEADLNAKLLEVLGRDAGVQVVTNLYNGSLSAGPPADSSLNLMRHNVRTIVEALR